MKICPECGNENRDKSFCTECGADLTDVETEENRIKREEKEKQEEIRRKDLEQKRKQAEIERIEREQKRKQAEIERIEREQKRKQEEFERKQRGEKIKKKSKQKSRLKIIGVLIIIIAVLCAGLYFVINQNNTQFISDLPGSGGNAADEQIISNDVNSGDSNFKTVDFNGLFKIKLPVECDFSELPGNTNVGATNTWHNSNSGIYYDSIYYYGSNNNLNDILNKFSVSKYETDGNLILFDDNGRYFVGVQSSNNEFVVLSANNINELDNLKKSANSIVFI